MQLTINILGWYFPIFMKMLLYLSQNEKRIMCLKIKREQISATWYFSVIRTKYQVGKMRNKWQRLIMNTV
jgi:hypothetical protein